MMGDISLWVKNIFLVILAISFIEIVLPGSGMRKYLRFIFSLIIMVTVLTPVIECL